MFDPQFRNEVESAFNQAFSDPSSFARADAGYRAKFRSEPYLASQLVQSYLDLEYEEGDLEPVDWFKDQFNVDYQPDLLMCDLCNYKGEGEGEPTPFERVKNLPVFRSKNHSMSEI